MKGQGAYQCMAMPAFASHPNRLGFEGCLAQLDRATDKSPSGARGHNVVLPGTVAAAALPSLLGMGVNVKLGCHGHDVRKKVGVITCAWIDGRRLMVAGHLFERDFPELPEQLSGAVSPMGMSYEVHDAFVADMRARVWVLTRVTFIGAAILLRSRAAYAETSFRIMGGTSADSEIA